MELSPAFPNRRRYGLTGTVLACLTLLVSGATGCVPAGAAGGGAIGGSSAARSAFGRLDERQRIGSFSTIEAVAVTRRFVFAGGSGGIAVYDRLRDVWMPPLTRDNGFMDQQITVMAGDPVEDALWFGVPGGVATYRPQTEQLQRTMLTGVPDVIAFDRRGTGDAMVRAGGSWTRVSRIGLTTPMNGAPAANSVIVPSNLGELYQRYPTLRIQPQSLLRNQSPNRPLQQFALLSGAASPDRVNDVWLGTDGDGLYRLDPAFLQAQPLRFGLLEPGVGALALAADGVWAAGLGQSMRRGGLSFTTPDLQRWRWIEGTIGVPLTGLRTYALATRANRAWLGTARGLVRVFLDGANDMTAWTAFDGLPDERVLAVAPRDDGVWVGTPRGVVRISDSLDTKPRETRGLGARLLENVPVYALQFTGDTLWMGTEGGVVALPRAEAGGGTLLRPLGDDPALRRPVRSLAYSDSVLLAATDNAVLAVAPRGGRAPQRVDALNLVHVGQVTRVGIDARAMWAAGMNGLVIVSRTSGAVRVVSAVDLGGPVLDVVANTDWMWIGTPQGLVRLRRSSDGLTY
ncbi:MAG: hypothetical protein IBJ03_17205 [Gemmatimonadaceae bacterium]|nr:hypothetical protein [Gemmatimonadaceae bacterium]